MHRRSFISSFVSVALAVSAPVYAQPNDTPPSATAPELYRNKGAHQPQAQGKHEREKQRDHRDRRGAGPQHQFHRGDRLPAQYRHRSYVVNDWRRHRLSAPPAGHHWIQTGSDYLLIAIATGLIVQMVLND